MVVDGRAVLREGLGIVIDQEPGLVVVAQAASVHDAGDLGITPDVIVTNIDLPDAKFGDAVSGLRELCPRSSILVFTPIGDPAEVQSAFEAGASGYLLETAETTELLAAIRAVARGETYLHPLLGVEVARSRSWDTLFRLTTQEKRILLLLVRGHTNVDVARLCNISLRTAETHRAHIQRKLGRHTRAELVEYARETGLVQFGPE
jgi:two-component system, NarL family, response regulator NreC